MSFYRRVFSGLLYLFFVSMIMIFSAYVAWQFVIYDTMGLTYIIFGIWLASNFLLLFSGRSIYEDEIKVVEYYRSLSNFCSDWKDKEMAIFLNFILFVRFFTNIVLAVILYSFIYHNPDNNLVNAVALLGMFSALLVFVNAFLNVKNGYVDIDTEIRDQFRGEYFRDLLIKIFLIFSLGSIVIQKVVSLN